MTEQPDQPQTRPATSAPAGTTTTAPPRTAPAPRTAAEATRPPATEPAPTGGTGPATEVDRSGVLMDRAGDAMERAAAASGRVTTAVIDRLRNDAEFVAERGSTRIEDEVVEKIAGIAAREVPGVHDLGGDTARFFASVKERVGLGEADKGNRGVSVRLDGQTARVGVTLVVEYGIQVYPVTEQVRATVIDAVESMLGLQIVEVNIVVDDVAPPGAQPGSYVR